MKPAALGFSPHSGWAALVALAGDVRAPEVALRMHVEMADDSLAGAAQPYHALEGLALKDAQRRLERFRETAQAMARAAVEGAVAELRRGGYAAEAAAILQGGGRPGATLEAILASHPLIHTADGDHFRDALAEACRRSRLAVSRLPAKQLVDEGARVLRLAPAELQKRVAALGRAVGPPWGADQKSAALAAWRLLAGR